MDFNKSGIALIVGGSSGIDKAVAKNMRTLNGGNIVNIGSMWSKQAVKATPSSSYSMTKAGLHALTQYLAMELSDYNIRVNAVSPTVVKTPIYNSFINENEVDEALDGFNDFHPFGRIGTSEDIAEFRFYKKSSHKYE